MKKFLVLALVLGMVGFASAGISIRSDKDTLVESELATITIYNTDPNPIGWFGFAAIIIGGPGEWTGGYNVLAPELQGSAHEVTYYGDIRPDFPYDAWYVDLSNPVTGAPHPAMDYISFVFHCTGVGPVDIVVTDDAGVILDTVTITQITPEPMTMLLLGLGGLFLRKR